MGTTDKETFEREALIGVLVMSPLSDYAGQDMRPIERTADAVLAAGFHRTPAPSDDLVERVAKNIASAAYDWVDWCDDDDHALEHTNWEAYLDDARAAIAVMKEDERRHQRKAGG